MLTNDVVKSIEEFVYPSPRSITEIANHLDVNWRTADRYIDYIEKNFGTLSSKTFRGGTRGALKIVFWSSVEKASKSVFQESLERDIKTFKHKYDFHAFDIFQHVPDKLKSARVEYGDDESTITINKLSDMLLSAKKQLLFFSGNLSFTNFKDKNTNIFKTLDSLVKSGVKIKVLCRVDLEGLNNVQRLLSLNYKYGKELVEIRHCEQPLRATIVDDKLIDIEERKDADPIRKVNELKNRAWIFYSIKDKDWVSWLTKIFWNMFSKSIDANKRILEIKKISGLRKD